MIAAAKVKYLQEQIAPEWDQLLIKSCLYHFTIPVAFAVTLVKSREQAEEVVSDVFINIWEKRKRINSISNLKSTSYSR